MVQLIDKETDLLLMDQMIKLWAANYDIEIMEHPEIPESLNSFDFLSLKEQKQNRWKIRTKKATKNFHLGLKESR